MDSAKRMTTPTNNAGTPLDTQDLHCVPGWLHWLSVGTVLLTVALLALGAMVTTLKVGMADPIWPTTPWYLFFIDWQEPSSGFLIEHTHRLFGYAVGLCSIILALGFAFGVRSGPLRWLGVVALGAVIFQGFLGGYRVRLHELFGPGLAVIHGVFAQVVFSILVCSAMLTTRSARESRSSLDAVSGLWLPSLLLIGLLFTQLVLGALVRHDMTRIAPRLHLLMAFGVIVSFGWFFTLVRSRPHVWAHSRTTLLFLVGLFGLQIFLGVESWMSKFAFGFYPEWQPPVVARGSGLTVGYMLRIAHVVVGASILATTVGACVRIFVASRETDSTPHSPGQDRSPTPRSTTAIRATETNLARAGKE